MTGFTIGGFTNNTHKIVYCIVLLALVTLFSGCADDNEPDGQDLYVDFCADCHGLNNEGTLTPANGLAFSVPAVIDQTEFGIIQAIIDVGAMNRPDLETLTTNEIRAIAEYIPTL